MNVHVERADRDEIVIRYRENEERASQWKAQIEEIVFGKGDLLLIRNGTEFLIPKKEILFFESSAGKVYAHTADRMYTAPYKLFELESLLPPSFVRISKSAIANVERINSVRRELVGNGEITFVNSTKNVFFSRNYYKLLQYRIEEMRLGK